MQSSKFIAIAVLAMVIVPIGAGYCLSMEDVERSGWQTVQESNLSDRLLNSTAPYYLPVSSPANNGLLIDAGKFSSPEYVKVSSTPSSIPTYDTTRSTINSSVATTTTVSTAGLLFNIDGKVYTDSYVQVADSVPIRINLSSGFSVTGNDGSVIYSNVTSIIVSPNTTDSGVGWVLSTISGAQVAPGLGGVQDRIIISTVSGGSESLQVVTYATTTISDNYWSLIASVASPTTFRFLSLDVSLADGTHYYASGAGGITAIGSSGVVSIYGYDTVNLDSVTSIKYSVINSSVIYYKNTPTGQYADPAEGWRFPASGGSYHSSGVWSNGAPNSSVTMMITPSAMLGNASLTLSIRSTPYDSSVADVLAISTSGATLNGVPFTWPARLSAAMPFTLTITETKITITIIDSWPAMGADPVRYGSITLQRSQPGEIFGIAADVQDYNDLFDRWTFRVDSASILAGHYPVTDSATLDITEIFGDVPYSIRITSVGVYGDSLTVGSVTYPVTDGEITINGQTYRVLQLTIGIVPGDGNYIITFNGDNVDTSAAYPMITFNGIWSVSVRGWTLEPFTSSNMEWVPGKFGLDDKSVSILGIITAVGVFIALALVRPFSGSKMIMLAIVCGCGAIIFLIIL